MRLKRRTKEEQTQGPVVLVVMDGVAIGRRDESDAVHLAHTPTLDALSQGMWTTLRAHGTAVGMPSDGDMGNSEVGHNALGAGRVFAQGARLVQEAIDSGAIFDGNWQNVTAHCKDKQSTLHLLGLLSDGNVHSHEKHLHAMLRQAAKEGVKRARVHALLDGRDVPDRSALEYIDKLEAVFAEINAQEGFDYQLASGGGRMLITMDRYEADWELVKRGWALHVRGEGRQFASARDAIETLRREYPDANDQYLPSFVIAKDGEAVGPVVDGDAVVLFNFRGDRAIEMCRAFEDEDFTPFDRGTRPDVLFVGMMQYDGDLHIPQRFLVSPPHIERTMSEYLCHEGVRQFAISETQKFGHVTYFWNGNKSGKFNEELEAYVEIPSDDVPFEERPWMKAAEITDETIKALRSGTYQFLRLNYPNGDMIGHTGNMQAAIQSVACVDLCLARLLKVVKEVGGVALITADHGNSDDMFERDKQGQPKRDENGNPKIKTSHSLNPVPFYIFDPKGHKDYQLSELDDAGLSHVAATVFYFLGFEAPEDYDPSLVTPA